MTWTDQMTTAYTQGTYILTRDATLVGHDKVAQYWGAIWGLEGRKGVSFRAGD